ncbi:MAG: CobW family GTP-binding protein [Cecembia sp.]
MQRKITTYLLTGFLGAGKTSLLNNLLENKKAKLNYVIENEFGKVSVDGNLVSKNYQELFELNNGCICCSLDGELVTVLAQLIQADKLPDNLFIEASGVADAGQLASIFRRDDVMNYYDIQPVICLVDAENFEDRIEEVPEIYRQIIASDLVLVNKSDLVQKSYIQTLQTRISSINPFAKVESIQFGKFDPLLLSYQTDYSNISDQVEIHSEEKSTHRMKSIAVEVPYEFDRTQLYVTLSMSIFLLYHQIYRIKGFVKLKGEEKPVLVQSTGNKLTITSSSNLNKNPELILVFIGRGIERQGIEKLMKKALKAETVMG